LRFNSVGTLQTYDDRNRDIAYFLVSIDYALRYTIATNNSTENIDENRFHIRILKNNIETRLYRFRVCSTTYVKEVGRLATGKFDNVHGSHCQSGAVHHTTHVSVKFNVVQVRFSSLNLC